MVRQKEGRGTTLCFGRPKGVCGGLCPTWLRKSSNEPEEAQIAIDCADEMYREVRIENALTD